MGRAGLTFAGDVGLGRALARATSVFLAAGTPPLDAVQKALLNISPIPNDRPLSAIFGAVTDSGPALWSYASTHQARFMPAPDIVQFGSINEYHTNLSAQFLHELILADRLHDLELLASALALIQSYGIHHALMDQGVGGHFTGAFIDAKGGHWQPDTLFMLYDSAASPLQMKCISSLVRDNVHAIGSSVTRDVRCFAHDLSIAQQGQWRNRWEAEVQDKAKNGNFGYIVFLDTRFWRVVVVEMAGQNKHRHVLYHPTTSKEGNTDLSPYLAEILLHSMEGDPLRMNFLQYEPPDQQSA